MNKKVALVASIAAVVGLSWFNKPQTVSRKLMVEDYTPAPVDFDVQLFEKVCPAAYPPLHGSIHDRRPEAQVDYVKHTTELVTMWNRPGEDTPKLRVISDPYFIVHEDDHSKVNVTCWNDKDEHIRGFGWNRPNEAIKNNNDQEFEVYEGDYAMFSTHFEGNFGHFVHDALPTIAYLRTQITKDTQIFLIDTKVTRNILKFLDEQFYNRVIWINKNQPIHIRGNLIVAVPQFVPIITGCCRLMDYMRDWVHEVKPMEPELNDQSNRNIVFYTRGGSKDTFHGRVLDDEVEKTVLDHIRKAMRKYGRKEKLVIFDGQEDGHTMSIEHQYDIFRKATTIIGPHGSGMGGNFLWTDPNPTDCNNRIQLLEFIPGRDSAQVQSAFVTYYHQFRKWPIEFHNVLYTANSTQEHTYINIEDFDMAIDAMWGFRTTGVRGGTMA